MVNRTYGRNDEWRTHPVKKEITLKVNIIFFILTIKFFIIIKLINLGR